MISWGATIFRLWCSSASTKMSFGTTCLVCLTGSVTGSLFITLFSSWTLFTYSSSIFLLTTGLMLYTLYLGYTSVFLITFGLPITLSVTISGANCVVLVMTLGSKNTHCGLSSFWTRAALISYCSLVVSD